ncbi:KinB-signaling pathway activation protein [Bacillus sp. FJAT-27251]|uniref:KinB-signaling pathway activation protein n=1 Tax=Bacillus sp. FJAT-27251 TaxID=1684142 RepID=UPI0006A7DB24|nr:KinB-signaling pathway activation protein [Bacillus sp. FJAT-27251]
MTSRNWVRLFMSTLLLGGLTTGVTGFIVRWDEFAPFFSNFNLAEILAILFWLLGVGFIFSLLSQAGFFAYLTIHRFGLGIFKTVRLWNTVQVILIALVLFDLVYFRYAAFAESGSSLLPYLGLALLVLLPALAVAYLKSRQTNSSAFVPALFFMVVATTLEWVPILRVNEQSWVYLMLFPLIVCNAYQLLMLPKLNQKSQEERQNKKTSVEGPVKASRKKPSNA